MFIPPATDAWKIQGLVFALIAGNTAVTRGKVGLTGCDRCLEQFHKPRGGFTSCVVVRLMFSSLAKGVPTLLPKFVSSFRSNRPHVYGIVQEIHKTNPQIGGNLWCSSMERALSSLLSKTDNFLWERLSDRFILRG
jgi:hypothetical protein